MDEQTLNIKEQTLNIKEQTLNIKEQILNIENLKVSIDSEKGTVQPVRGISFTINKGEVFAIVGESGCGKSVTAQTIMKLNPMPPVHIDHGQITLLGKDIINAEEKEMQSIRGHMVSMIFQDPMTSLNPTMRIGKQITESLRRSKHLSQKECKQEAVRLLEMVQIFDAKRRSRQYPHEFSGGMRQRVMIGMALALNPQLLIADEPTTALDTTIQAQVLSLLEDIRCKMGTSILLITHDLGVVAHMADRVAVMYAGKIVEQGYTKDIFGTYAHPYTKALIQSIPVPKSSPNERLAAIPGSPPDLINPPIGCAFAGRCVYSMKICVKSQPPIFQVGLDHSASCWRLHRDFPK